MSVSVMVTSDIKNLSKWLTRTQKTALPSAIRNALNETAVESMKWWKNNLSRYIDRPTKYTIKNIQYTRAEKHRLISTVGFASKRFGKPIGRGSAYYMKLQIEGGTRLPEKRSIAVPTSNYKTNQFGNIGKPGKIKSLLEKPNYFSGQVKGKAGIFKRSGLKKRKKVQMMIAWEPKTRYQRRFNFPKISKNIISRIFKPIYEKQLNAVLRKKKLH